MGNQSTAVNGKLWQVVFDKWFEALLQLNVRKDRVAGLLQAEDKLLSQCFRLQTRALPVAFVDAPAIEKDDLFYAKSG